MSETSRTNGYVPDAFRNTKQVRSAAEEVLRLRELAAGLDDIARAARVTKGRVYHRFGGRRGLVDAVMITRSLSCTRTRHSETLRSIAPQFAAAYLLERLAITARSPPATARFITNWFRCIALTTGSGALQNGNIDSVVGPKFVTRAAATSCDFTPETSAMPPPSLAAASTRARASGRGNPSLLTSAIRPGLSSR